LIYFSSMQCPDCSYISFKQAKSCSSCGFDFKKAAASTASLFRNDSFTIFSAPAKEQESSGAPTAQAGEGVAIADPPEGSQETPELESGEFLLNLPDPEQESSATTLKSAGSEPDTDEFVPMEFGSDADINLEEMEVEGLGLGLEPIENETPTTAKTEPEEIPVEVSQEPEVVELAPEEGSSDSPIEVALDEEPVLEITPTPEKDTSTLKINGLNDAPSSEDKVDVEAEPVAPVLDLGDGEISLDLDEDLKPASPAEEPAPPSAQIDELEIKLEIDDSEGPLTTKSDETPEIEIEDLGLELEGSDSPPDPEKP